MRLDRHTDGGDRRISRNLVYDGSRAAGSLGRLKGAVDVHLKMGNVWNIDDDVLGVVRYGWLVHVDHRTAIRQMIHVCTNT